MSASEADWSWFAGYIEAKKSLGSYTYQNRGYVTIDITSKDFELLDDLSLLFDLPKPFHLKTIDSYRIAIRSKDDVGRVLLNISPHLKSNQDLCSALRQKLQVPKE